MTPAVVNVAFQVWYPQAQQRLQATLEAHGFRGATYFWTEEYPPDAPEHHIVPYAFKTYAFAEARRRGHRVVLWIDASIFPVRDVAPVIEHILEKGYLFVANGLAVGPWISDKALEVLGVGREESFAIPSLTGGFMGLDFGHPKGREFFRKWHGYSRDGTAFRGSWENDPEAANPPWHFYMERRGFVSRDPRVKGHRHDQAVGSVLAWQMGLELVEQPRFFAYRGPGPDLDARTVFVIDRPGT